LGRNHPGSAPPADAARSAVDAKDAVAHGGVGGFGSQSQGWTRLFSGEFGFEIGWLIPAALVATVLVLVARRRAPRTDLVRAGAVLFGTWIVVDGLVLSYMHGMIHPYYSLSIAPAVAAMFAIGTQQMWALRESLWGRVGLAGTLLATGIWSWWLLARNEEWLPGLRWAILALTAVACVGLVGFGAVRARRTTVLALAGVAVAGALAGPAAYAIVTVGSPHQGGGPQVGPARAGHSNMMWGKLTDNPQLDAMLDATNTPWSAAIDRSSAAAGLELSTNTAVMAIGGFSGTDPTPTLAQFTDDVANHRVAYYVASNNKGHGPGWNGHTHADIAEWVAATFTPQKVGDVTVYDLAAPK
jgi:4-amino-4-deoxy-L-arabinose transferase-like glycosyltransferase